MVLGKSAVSDVAGVTDVVTALSIFRGPFQVLHLIPNCYGLHLCAKGSAPSPMLKAVLPPGGRPDVLRNAASQPGALGS